MKMFWMFVAGIVLCASQACADTHNMMDCMMRMSSLTGKSSTAHERFGIVEDFLPSVVTEFNANKNRSNPNWTNEQVIAFGGAKAVAGSELDFLQDWVDHYVDDEVLATADGHLSIAYAAMGNGQYDVAWSHFDSAEVTYNDVNFWYQDYLDTCSWVAYMVSLLGPYAAP
jgi:hypothetical protein